ncbi:hypothetical protein QU481_09370 [Crenobacter sp. SG2303]|uniref:Uncharacterized protein n=1 Tax=Crenobacter oryzisoli TaxID=3056844 RepID=A0ABT7XMT1_9NEIS|nr:hypothetical protein [Crenobacter sp. SG2303]MDN0075102.1 hypothetical protein [Crenobacter sp. SG2303]
MTAIFLQARPDQQVDSTFVPTTDLHPSHTGLGKGFMRPLGGMIRASTRDFSTGSQQVDNTIAYTVTNLLVCRFNYRAVCACRIKHSAKAVSEFTF